MAGKLVRGTHALLRRYAHLRPGQRLLSAVLVTALIGLVLGRPPGPAATG